MERAEFENWSAKDVSRLLALVEGGRRYYQEIVAIAPIGLLVVGSDGALVMANRRFREIFALRGEDLTKRTLDEIVPVEGLRSRVLTALESRSPQYNLTVDLPGNLFIRLDIVPIEDVLTDKGPEALIFAQETSAAARPTAVVERQTALSGEIPAILWEADTASGQFLWVNQSAERLLGYPPKKWLEEKQLFPDRIHPEDRGWMEQVYRTAAEKGSEEKCEYRSVA